jgi:hypothetical protein
MKKLINFNFTFKGFDGAEVMVVDQNGNEIPGGVKAWFELGKQLSSSATKDGNTAVKYFGLAQMLGSKQELELDQADIALLKEFIGSAHLRADFKAQLLEAIDNGVEVK